jgi:hypothetical protein
MLAESNVNQFSGTETTRVFKSNENRGGIQQSGTLLRIITLRKPQ